MYAHSSLQAANKTQTFKILGTRRFANSITSPDIVRYCVALMSSGPHQAAYTFEYVASSCCCPCCYCLGCCRCCCAVAAAAVATLAAVGVADSAGGCHCLLVVNKTPPIRRNTLTTYKKYTLKHKARNTRANVVRQHLATPM